MLAAGGGGSKVAAGLADGAGGICVRGASSFSCTFSTILADTFPSLTLRFATFCDIRINLSLCDVRVIAFEFRKVTGGGPYFGAFLRTAALLPLLFVFVFLRTKPG